MYLKKREESAPLKTKMELERYLPRYTNETIDFSQDDPAPLQMGLLIRKYLLLALASSVAGLLCGIVALLVSTPQYKATALLDVQPMSDSLAKQGLDPFAGLYNADATNLQTQVLLLDAGPFRARVLQKLADTKLLRPVDRTPLARLRSKLRHQDENSPGRLHQALEAAANSLEVRVISNTRLIELRCESPNPYVTAEFLNNIAEEFIADTVRNRSEGSEVTKNWLKSHFEETKSKLQTAEEKLRNFDNKAGNIFVNPDATVESAKAKQLQTELAEAEAARITAQANYESAARNDSAATLPQAVQDAIVQSMQSKLAEVKREKAARLGYHTPLDPKVKDLTSQEQQLELAIHQEVINVIARLRSEYENASRHESLLATAYTEVGQQVTAQASKAAEYTRLRREVDTLRAMYDSLLQEMSKTEVLQSAPVVPLRLVSKVTPPAQPYKPNSTTELLLGLVTGLGIACAIAVLREKQDRSLRSPEAVQNLVRVPQLGVIPATTKRKTTTFQWRCQILSKPTSNSAGFLQGIDLIAPNSEAGLVVRAAWKDGVPGLADSFRATMASLVKHIGAGHQAKVLMISSSVPGEGKTTISANLAIALAEAGKRVVVIDADFRRTTLTRLFELSTQSGLPQLLIDERPVLSYQIEEIAGKTSIPNLSIVPSSSGHPQLSTLVHSPRLPKLLERLRREFEIVLVDVPPILFPADTQVIGQFVDGAVLIIRAGQSEPSSVLAAVNQLRQDRIPILGTVLNDWKPEGPRSGMSYYQMYEGYQS